MTRRGRPPHPDVLTPREWEVLALLREGLGDQAVADRLGISLDGAKYHVREILSKLSVSSRQEAAAWHPEERRAARSMALPLVVRAAGVAVMAAAVAGLGVLAWGVLRTETEAGRQSVLGLPTASAPQPEADEALLRASRLVKGDVREVQGTVTVWAAAKAAAGYVGPMLDEPRSDAATWFFKFSGVLTPVNVGPGGPANPEATPERPACMAIAVWFPDITSERGPQTYVAPGLDADCSRSPPVSRELAIVLASEGKYWQGQVADVEAAPSSWGEARQALASELHGFGTPREGEPPPDRLVWMVSMTAEYWSLEQSEGSEGSTPQPTTLLTCERRVSVIDASSRVTLVDFAFPSDACD
jgi:DNA-binding CsgD family transcriptional regulator